MKLKLTSNEKQDIGDHLNVRLLLVELELAFTMQWTTTSQESHTLFADRTQLVLVWPSVWLSQPLSRSSQFLLVLLPETFTDWEEVPTTLLVHAPDIGLLKQTTRNRLNQLYARHFRHFPNLMTEDTIRPLHVETKNHFQLT